MNIKKLNRKGFSHVEMVIVVLVVAVLGFVGWEVLKNTSHAGTNCTGQTLSQGSSGQCVKDLQSLVNGFVTTKLAVDGSFGPNTATGVKSFQDTTKLSVDGVVGSNTWSKLCNTAAIYSSTAFTNAQKDACGKNVTPVHLNPTQVEWSKYNNYTTLSWNNSIDNSIYAVKACISPAGNTNNGWEITVATETLADRSEYGSTLHVNSYFQSEDNEGYLGDTVQLTSNTAWVSGTNVGTEVSTLGPQLDRADNSRRFNANQLHFWVTADGFIGQNEFKATTKSVNFSDLAACPTQQ